MHDHHSHSRHDHHSSDHTAHHLMMIEDFKKRFLISIILTIPILILSPLIQELLNYQIDFKYANYTLFILSTFIYFYGGRPFLLGLGEELKEKQPGMMTLIAVAITVAFAYSSATTFGMEGKKFFWELATLIDIMLLGHYIEMKSVVSASSSLQKLIELIPSNAHLVIEDNIKDIKVEELKIADIILIRPGETVPADGNIVDGETTINESMLTGESKPVKKGKGDKVIGGTINNNGALKIEVTQIGDNAYLNKVIKMIRQAQSEKSKTQHLADKIAFWLTIIALGVGFGTLISWIMIGKPFVFALERMASVMIITCPHALGLAIPLVVAISTTISAKNGLLIRNRTAFENSSKITLLAFDKTGTLTKGNFGVSKFTSLNSDYKDLDILIFAAAVEAKSEHPISVGIVEKTKQLNIKLPETKNFNSITGKGIEADIEDINVKVVSPLFLKEMNISIPKEILGKEDETVVFVMIENKLSGFITLSDEIREEAYEAVKILKQTGLKLFMITGDNEKVAKSVSERLGLDGYFSETLPDQKLAIIKNFRSKNEFVAMVGDGINDAPALASADIGIAIGSGTDIAAQTSDIILVNSDPKDIASLIIFGKETHKKMIQNFIWATAYNIIAIPLAAGVLFSKGILINPAFGALLMSLSTVIVAINAQLLKNKMIVKS